MLFSEDHPSAKLPYTSNTSKPKKPLKKRRQQFMACMMLLVIISIFVFLFLLSWYNSSHQQHSKLQQQELDSILEQNAEIPQTLKIKNKQQKLQIPLRKNIPTHDEKVEVENEDEEEESHMEQDLNHKWEEFNSMEH